MTIQQAAAISKANNLPIRRSSWPADKWFWVWLGGHWFSYPSGKPHTALATDYTSADLLANDWTTVPAPLSSCPVTPGEPIGGDPPPPSFPGWPDFPDPGFPSTPGVPILGGSGSTSLPPPNPGTGLSVTFEGMIYGSDSTLITDLKFGGPYPLKPGGAGQWTGEVESGTLHPSGDKVPWKITVTRHFPLGPKPYFKVSLSVVVGHSFSGADGGFFTNGDGALKGDPITNFDTIGYVSGGTATVN